MPRFRTEPVTAMKRFVIFCQARTGTHLLRTCLEQHRRVRCAWEPFNDKAVQHFPYTTDTPASHILDLLWRPQPGVAAAGFPLHLNHGRDGRAWPEVWDLLNGDDETVRIHLYRRNLLEQLTSHTLALRTGVWIHEDCSPPRPNSHARLTLDPEDCARWFDETSRKVHQHHRLTRHALTITYEELSTALPATTDAVFRALGLEPVPIFPRTRKQGRHPRRTLRNYDELEAAFSGTRWRSFFHDTDTHEWDTEIREATHSLARR